MKLITINLFAISAIFSQSLSNFPLWGSVWVVAQGDNKNVYASVLPLVPEKIAVMDFTSKSNAIIYWANLNNRNYKSTADLVEDIMAQLKKNSKTITTANIGSGDLIDIAYNPYNDTVWSGDAEAIGKLGTYQYIGRKTTTTDSVFGPADINRLHSTPGFYKDKPTYYGIRVASTTDISVYSFESTDEDGNLIYLANNQYIQPPTQVKTGLSGQMEDIGNVNLNALSETTPYQSYRTGNTIYEYIPVTYIFKTASIGFWQVHLHPEMVYYPRDPFDGTPLIKDALKMNYATAAAKKKQSIDNPNVVDYKYNRNPFYSDSASVVISFAFVGQPGVDMTKLSSISLKDTAVDINHYPDKMFRVEGTSGSSGLLAALYKLYTRDSAEEYRSKTLDQRCGSWSTIDKQNGEVIFPAAMQKAGSPLIRNKLIDNGVFLYNDCPCSQISALKNLTPVQLERLLYLNPPLCDRPAMAKALSLYMEMKRYLTTKKDLSMLEKRINTLGAIISDRDAKVKAAGIDWSQSNKDCPSTWVTDF